MTLPTLIWTAVCLWAAVSSETPPEDPALSVLYPPIGDTVTLTCESPHDLLSVHWFRVQHGEETNATFQYLLQITQSARTILSADVDGERFKVALRGLRASTLRVVDVTERDAGIYSCVFEVRHASAKRAELWRPGVLLRPGVTPPPPPPGTSPPSLVGPKCRCPKSSKKVWFGCSTMVLWPLAGVLLGLGVALIATVFYFSRLPRKCRHRFAKKMLVN